MTAHTALDTLDGLTRAYRYAEYRWQQDNQWHHLHIGQPAPHLEALAPEASCFGLLSAWNPWSVQQDDALNRAADEALHATLLEAGIPCRPAFASAHNRTWREPSWIVMGMDVDAFDALFRRFEQLGALWWQTGEPVRLRMDARCPPGLASLGSVDWLQG